ncbi:MAG TPA: helix-turn-helix transcriptional regulator [Blastocatellia bacterium]
MVEIKVREIAEKKGIGNPHQLSTATGLHYSVCHAYWNGNPKQISAKAVNKLCNALGVKPSQIFEYTPDT